MSRLDLELRKLLGALHVAVRHVKEEVVDEGLLGADPPRRVQGQELLQQVEALAAHVLGRHLEALAASGLVGVAPEGELQAPGLDRRRGVGGPLPALLAHGGPEVVAVVRVLGQAGGVLAQLGRAAHVEDLGHHVGLAVGGHREEGLLEQELAQNAPDAPHVGRGAVLGGAHEDLGGAEPEGEEVGRVPVQLFREGAGQPPVGDLELVVAAHEDVAALEVAVHDVVLVHVGDPVEELVGEAAHVGGAQAHRRVRLGRLKQALQVELEVLKHHVDGGRLL
mmetsp:Transcript_63352/g.142892  ORF Transcript_63352/g.142892 Transcript_63352/m.142892 type:complete len:279 (-) Transcript_63352:1049-1885(-)